MPPVALDIALQIAAIFLSAFIVLRAFPLLKSGKKIMTTALFIFAIVSFMLSIAYWLIYSLIRPGTRMPFAANEIGEIAWFLLLSSVLNTIFRERNKSAFKEIVFAAIFAIASVVLWIAWSGEWMQDIIFGFAFGYFLCVCVRSLEQVDVFNRIEWLVLGCSCAAIIIAQAGTFFVSDALVRPLDLLCYLMMFAVLIWLLVKSISVTRKGEDTEGAFAMSFVACAFGFSTLYMSSGWFYTVAFAVCLATLSLMLRTLRREVLA